MRRRSLTRGNAAECYPLFTRSTRGETLPPHLHDSGAPIGAVEHYFYKAAYRIKHKNAARKQFLYAQHDIRRPFFILVWR